MRFHDRQGRRSTVADGSGVRSLGYNTAGLPAAATYTDGLMEGLSVEQGYDSLLRRNALTLKAGSTTLRAESFGYGSASRLASVSSGEESVEYGYLTNSPLVTTVTFKHLGTTVMTTTKSYDFVNRLTSTQSVAGSTTVSEHEYEYNTLNQRERVELTGGGHWEYEYNSKGEVIGGTRFDASNNPVAGLDLGYGFDGIGNREETKIDGVTSSTYTSNELNQYTSITGSGAATPSYDDDGNMTANGTGMLFEYDGENRLKTVKRSSDDAVIATYTYDEQGRRVRKQTTSLAAQGATDRLSMWDGWNRVAELDYDAGAGTVDPVQFYTWGIDASGSMQGAGGVGGLVLEDDASSGTTHLPTYDGNGNLVRLVAASSGVVTASYEYDPFGKIISQSGSYADENPWRFSTKPVDAETDLLYYGYRFYNPETGRWLSRDPLGDEAFFQKYTKGKGWL